MADENTEPAQDDTVIEDRQAPPPAAPSARPGVAATTPAATPTPRLPSSAS